MRFLLFGIPAALVVYGALAVVRPSSPIARMLGKLGDASYALYLTHGFVMTAYARLLQHLEGPRARAITPPATALLTDAAPVPDWTDAYAVEHQDHRRRQRA